MQGGKKKKQYKGFLMKCTDNLKKTKQTHPNNNKTTHHTQLEDWSLKCQAEVTQ